jgi:uncharacterized protein with PQ loop repeat
MEKVASTLGLAASILLPLWNIPLILRIHQRKSAEDISMAWLFGVWGCILAMLPDCLLSEIFAYKIFGIANVIMFTILVAVVLWHRKKQ